MKYSRLYLLTFLCLFLAIAFSPAQKKIIRQGGQQMWSAEGGDLFDLPELAVFITQEGENLAVTNVMDASSRPKGYEDVDIQLNDIILMANGKKMKKITDLETLYKEAKPGTTIKLGMKRGETMMIASFEKADPEKLPKRKMMIRKGGDEDFLGIPQVGLFIAAKDKKLVVSEVLDNAKEELNGADVKQGDEIIKLNGKSLSSFKELSKEYEALKEGDKVAFVTLRSGKEYTITFKKPKDEGGMKIIRKTIGD